MNKRYRVDISSLSSIDKKSTEITLKQTFMTVLPIKGRDGKISAFDVLEATSNTFKSVEYFKNVLKLPSECIVTDVTGWGYAR